MKKPTKFKTMWSNFHQSYKSVPFHLYSCCHMLIHNFARLRLTDTITSTDHAMKHFKKPEVSGPINDFFKSLLLNCECPPNINRGCLVVAYFISKFGINEPMTDQKTAFIASSSAFVATVQAVMEECGTAETSHFESLSEATKCRVRAAVIAQMDTYKEFYQTDIIDICSKIEKALEALYIRQAMPTTPASELTELAFHINRFRAEYEQYMPDGLARFDEKHSVAK